MEPLGYAGTVDEVAQYAERGEPWDPDGPGLCVWVSRDDKVYRNGRFRRRLLPVFSIQVFKDRRQVTRFEYHPRSPVRGALPERLVASLIRAQLRREAT